MVQYHKDQTTPISNVEGVAGIDSDCEEDSSDGWEEMLKTEEEEQEQGRAVFVVGSFSAYDISIRPLSLKNDELSSWKSLFFYRCTDEMTFAPFKSQGLDSRLKYIGRNTVAMAPHPCSPKSIFILASLVRKQPIQCLPVTDALDQA